VRDSSVYIGAVALAARDYGGDGRAVVLVHGGPGPNLAIWDEFAPKLTGRVGLWISG